MLKDRTLTVGQSQTLNLGEFNSVKIWIEFSGNLEDDSDVEEVKTFMEEAVRSSIRTRAKPFIHYVQLPRPKERPEFAPVAMIKRLFLGKPVETD